MSHTTKPSDHGLTEKQAEVLRRCRLYGHLRLTENGEKRPTVILESLKGKGLLDEYHQVLPEGEQILRDLGMIA